MICYQILSTNSLKKCMKISMESLYVDIGLKGLRNQNSTLLFIGHFDVVLEMSFTLWNCLCPTLLSNIVIANNGSSGVHREQFPPSIAPFHSSLTGSNTTSKQPISEVCMEKFLQSDSCWLLDRFSIRIVALYFLLKQKENPLHQDQAT